MKRKITIGIVVILLLMLAALVYLSLTASKARWIGYSRVKVQPKVVVAGKGSYQEDIEALAKLFHKTDARRAIAASTKQDEAKFTFVDVRRLANTTLLEIRFLGDDNDSARLAAFEASRYLAMYYATNNPTFEVETLDSGSRPPQPWWRLVLNRATDMLGRK